MLVQKSNTAQRNVGRRATTETKSSIWAPAEQKQEPFTCGEPTQLPNARCCVDGKAIKWLFPYGSCYIVTFAVWGGSLKMLRSYASYVTVRIQTVLSSAVDNVHSHSGNWKILSLPWFLGAFPPLEHYLCSCKSIKLL